MTAILQPSGEVVSGGGTAPADNVEGFASGVHGNATQTIVTVVAGSKKLRGYSLWSNVDCEAYLAFDGVEINGTRKRFSRVIEAVFYFPNPVIPPSAGTVVTVKVDNGPNTGDFKAILFAE